MRRKDREVTDREKIKSIILNCHCCRLGFVDEGEVYIVPLNFGFAEKEGKMTFYFHGAKEGRKIELIHKSPSVGFELDCNCEIIKGETACGYSARYQSVIGNGVVSFVNDMNEKYEALQTIMCHYTGKDNWEFTKEMADRVCVFKLEVDKLSCKVHL